MKTPKTLSDKVNALLSKQNGDASSDESAEETAAPRVTEFSDDEYELPQAQSTEFRKRNIKLLSEQSAKYKGKLSSRKELAIEEEDYEESESDEMAVEENATDSDDAAEVFKTFGKKLKQISNDKKKDESDEMNDSSNNDEDAEEYDSEEEADNDDDQQIVSESNRQTQVQKGVCVQNQLRIWEKLLELRIQSQKILTKANQLPAAEEFQAIKNVDALKEETVSNVSNLLSKLMDLQQALTQQYPEMRKEVKLGQKRSSQAAANNEPPSKRFGLELEQNFKAFAKYRDDVLLKWDDRTKVMTAASGKRKSAQEEYDILKKIAFALNNRQSLIQRSQTLKSNNNQLEQPEAESVAVLAHIYDDSDFYHHQLRELIEYKANTTSNMAEVTKQYVELQKLRQKMKKKVDTRASKGRKIRYVVHNKLMNFMAPEDTSTWTEQSKDELYKSLFVA